MSTVPEYWRTVERTEGGPEEIDTPSGSAGNVLGISGDNVGLGSIPAIPDWDKGSLVLNNAGMAALRTSVCDCVRCSWESTLVLVNSFCRTFRAWATSPAEGVSDVKATEVATLVEVVLILGNDGWSIVL